MELYSEPLAKIEETFRRLGVPLDEPGFYDHPAFVEEEKRNKHILSAYAAYVRQRPYTTEYLHHAEATIRRATELLHDELVRDGRLGACIDASMSLSRMLEREGIWSICIQGAFTLTFGSGNKTEHLYCQPVSDSKAVAAHVWLIAPPFEIVDVTIGRQEMAPHLRKQLPPYVLAKNPRSAVVEPRDICSTRYRREAEREGLKGKEIIYAYRPDLREFFKSFPAGEVRTKRVSIKFVPCATGASDGPLENITALRLSGRTAAQIYEETIKPALRGSA